MYHKAYKQYIIRSNGARPLKFGPFTYFVLKSSKGSELVGIICMGSAMYHFFYCVGSF